MFWKSALVACGVAITMACGGSSPTGPTGERIPRLSRTRFLAFGDSITAGEVTSPVGASGITRLVVVPSASYPTVLQSQLTSQYSAQASSILVNNQGRSGETIVDGALRFGDVFDTNRPEVVLLQEGVNGLGVAGPDATTALMRQMVQRASHGSARVFVGSMVPTLPNRQRSQNPDQLVAYNDRLRTMCVEEGVTYVDLYDPLLADAATLIGSDGLHPNEAGYRRIADLFFASIRATLEEP